MNAPLPATHTASDTKARLEHAFRSAIAQVAPDVANEPVLERPKQATHGDYACNVALQLSKALKKNPRELAQAIVNALHAPDVVAKTEIAGPGFINVFLTHEAKFSCVRDVLRAGDAYGLGTAGINRKMMVEFVSANPTGPLHVGHGRQAALGDSICRLLESQGWTVLREFYYNDAGNQINTLTLSTQARIRELRGEPLALPADGYHGEYIIDIAREYVATHAADPRGDDLEAVRKHAVAYLRAEQDADLKAFDVRFESFFLESSLYTTGKVSETVELLKKGGKTYEQEGALWLRTTDYGDDKDRVMRKSDGSFTYFVPDVAYHLDKFRRGYAHAVNVQGADHHSTVTRVRAGLQALGTGVPQGYPDYVLHQMVTVMKGGEEVKLSKRAGSYVTLRDLIDEVGKDAVRYFLVMRKTDSHLNFDLDLAKSQSEDNPVYYVQYAHARIASVLREWGGDVSILAKADLRLLGNAHESALVTRVADFPVVLAAAAREFAPHAITQYLMELAQALQSYYANDEKWLKLPDAQKQAKLALIRAVQQVIKNGLAIIGVSAPDRM